MNVISLRHRLLKYFVECIYFCFVINECAGARGLKLRKYLNMFCISEKKNDDCHQNNYPTTNVSILRLNNHLLNIPYHSL